MISALNIAILVSTSAATMDAESGRVAYNNCLVEFTTTHLEQKTGLRDFRNAAKQACSTERGAWVTAIKKDELEYGSTSQEALDYATEEAGNVLFSYIDSYTSYLNSNTRPVKE